MPSTYSPSLQLELIGAGEQAGTWNSTTNTNLGTLLDQAIAGYTTQAVTTGTDTTLTMTPGATAVARNIYIELTGSGGTNTNLIVPSSTKLYFIFNNTSSGQVTVKVAGQTGVSVSNLNKTILVCNGTDIVLATSAAAPGVTSVAMTVPSFLSVTGSPVTSTGTLAVTLSGTALPTANGGTGSTATTYCSLSSNVNGTLPVGNGGTGAGTLAGAGIPTFSATNSFTGVNGFGITANANTAAFAKAPSSIGAGIVAQNNGAGVPFAAASDSPTGTLMVYYYGTFPSSVTTNGYVQLSGAGVNYYSASDYRLKENVTPLSNATAKLKQLAPKNYTWIDYPEVGTVDGFIAHELQAIIPQAVSGEKDAIDQDGKPKYQAVDSSNLVPLLTAALQEALVRIEALEARVGV